MTNKNSANTSTLTLHNWRCFESVQFRLPSGNFLILDDNGIGKTSILSAYYSLLTGQPWPGTKFLHSIKLGQSWFGLSLDCPSYRKVATKSAEGVFISTTLNGKISGSRTTTKYETEFKNEFQVLTYQPTDNYWLSNSRESKLSVLNEIISSYNPEYSSKVSKLNQIVKSKTSLIKHIFDNDYYNPTPELLDQYNNQILELSLDIWSHRLEFLTFWQSKLPEFCELINCQVANWKIELQLTNSTTSKTLLRNLETLNSCNSSKTVESPTVSPIEKENQQTLFDTKKYLQTQLDLKNIDWTKTNNREIATGRVLLGAHRDEFLIFADQIPLQNILSRGEMRLFVLWSKSLAVKIQIQQTKNTIWLLDELDGERELSLINIILADSHQIIATGTKASSQVLVSHTIKNLTKI
jgi:recombinational DNA repair ATPase RecF